MAEDFGIKAPEGFEVSLFAGDDLAHDIYSMTIDSKGRIVVAGRDYVKILHDDDLDGKADRATLYSSVPKSGAHGMVFDGPDLLCTGDDALMKLRDTDGDGVADGPPEIWAKLKATEHGANGIARGPDGWFYVVCGNDAGVGEEHATTPGSPVKKPNCGAILRFSPDGKQSEIFAHGLRNPYDLDFNVQGHLFTVDSDGERDHHLPWYTPTRLFDVAQGMHHGWVQKGWQRSWSRPAHFFDNVERLVEIGRGSPTGLVVYRHRQFPDRYRGNVFTACWTLGRVYHIPLDLSRETYRSDHNRPEVFLETTGEVGFAPVDLAVGPEGDLFVAIGGRRTRGGVFRVRYVGKQDEVDRKPRPGLLDDVLAADQPLVEWSRARWVPKAKELGREKLEAACNDKSLGGHDRARAVEILTELFDGPSMETTEKLIGWAVPSPLVQARLAWSLGRAPRGERGENILAQMTLDDHDSTINRAVWESLASLPSLGKAAEKANWQHAFFQEKSLYFRRRLRAAAHLADLRRSEVDLKRPENATPEELLTWMWRLQFRGELKAEHLDVLAKDVLVPLSELRRETEVVRLMQLALGDLRVEAIEPDVYAGYTLRAEPRVLEAARKSINFEAHLDYNFEWMRLAGALNSDSVALLESIADVLNRIRSKCENPDDPNWPDGVTDRLHYLIVLSRLGGERTIGTTDTTVDALVSLHHRMAQQRHYPSRNWAVRVGEVFVELCKRDPKIAAEVVKHPKFVLPEQSLFAARMEGKTKVAAARKLLKSALALGEEAQWTSELVEVIAALPPEESLPALRRKWSDFGLRDSIVTVLAKKPVREDRARFIDSLSSVQPQVVETAATALRRLGGEGSPEELAIVLQTLRQFCANPPNVGVRRDLAALLKTWTGEPIETKDSVTATDVLAIYEPWFAWFAKAHPKASARLSGFAGVDAAAWRERLAKVAFDAGDADRGRTVYEKRACHRCHRGGGDQLGPDLAGAASRFSRDDLFAAIIDPSKDVAPLYQTMQLVTGSGKVYHGLVVYESPDGTLIQTAPDTTIRIAGQEIVSMRKSKQSLMPIGLLNGATDEELADLYVYLKTLRGK